MVHAEQLVVGLESGRLGQLGGEGVNPVPHPAGHGVLQLAEVVAAQSNEKYETVNAKKANENNFVKNRMVWFA